MDVRNLFLTVLSDIGSRKYQAFGIKPESLVHGREIHTDVEAQEEHELDQEAGVDEDVGDARTHPDGDAGGGCLIQRIWKPQR